jgi:AAA domain
MSNLERLGDSAAARKVFARVAETAQDGVVAIKPVVPLAEVLETIDLSEVRARPIDWLWRGYIPLRKVTILDGDPGLGKSTLLLDLACRGSVGGVAPTGEPLGDAFTTIYVTAEDDAEDTILPRVVRAGGDPSRFHLLRKLVLPDQIDRLEATASSLRARLIVIDPLMAYLGDEVKTNDDHRVRRAMEPLAEMAASLDAAVVAIRHLNKRAGDDAIYRGGGSIGFTGLARSVLAVGRDPEDHDRMILAPIKLNVARRPPSLAYRIVADGDYEPAHIAWDGTSDRTAEDLIGRTRDGVVGHSKTADLAAAIRELLESNGGSMPAGMACEALKKQGFDISSQDNLGRARGQAGVKSAKAGYAGGWVWSFSSSVNRSEPSVPSEPWQTNPSKTPKSPKTPTKTPKTPISSSKEEPVSSTPDPSPRPGAATFWEDNSLLQGTASASPRRPLEGRSR